MKGFRAAFFLFLILGIGSTIAILIMEPAQPPFSRTLAPFFQELGKPIKSVDRAISRVFPIDEIDEKMLGDEIKLRLARMAASHSPEEEATVRYLNSLIGFTTAESAKPFKYEVFLIEGSPNACAMPGGVICVTKGLMNILESEAELLAILGHEIGHIERGHLFDAARGEMLRRKIQSSSVPAYASEVIQMVVATTFNKTQEDEADEYGFRTLLKKGYDPFAMSSSFEKLLPRTSSNQKMTDPFNDFFSTHPYMELRIEKFRSRAKLWKGKYPVEKGYIGKKNFADRATRFEANYPDEWD